MNKVASLSFHTLPSQSTSSVVCTKERRKTQMTTQIENCLMLLTGTVHLTLANEKLHSSPTKMQDRTRIHSEHFGLRISTPRSFYSS